MTQETIRTTCVELSNSLHYYLENLHHTKIVEKIEELVRQYPSHFIDESLIKHKIIEVLVSEIKFPFNIENIQAEKTCKESNVNRCDIFYKYNKESVFLELKLNRLVLKLNSGKLTGGNVFGGDIIAI